MKSVLKWVGIENSEASSGAAGKAACVLIKTNK
jgi:hypothetical protein